jgi:CHASE2 domain-containing sensor protein
LSAFIANKLRNRFYICLAVLFSVAAILDATVFHLISTMNNETFDLRIRQRIVKPTADKEIIIVDIDEASLNAMAKDYGRWPWPRQVLGEFLENIEKQQPRAVVFDILFSDADVYNPDSDTYFNSAIEGTNNTFFPMLRLSEDNDRLSELMPWKVPGVTKIDDEPQQEKAVALILPHFQAALAGGRLGTHNIYPDKDGIARHYRIYRDDYGWKIPSLPFRIAQELKLPLPEEQDVLLNWRGKPFTYRFVSFSDVYADFLKESRKRPQDEFTGKIVIIGSTAPSLFDIKATPMDRLYPGVEILATAIDNLKHNDYLRVPQSYIPYLILALLIVWVTAMGFFLNFDLAKFDRGFGLSQVLLVTVSYASINFTTTYIDLTGPVTIGLAFFSIARVYAAATEKALDADVVISKCTGADARRGVLMLVQILSGGTSANEQLIRRIRTDLKRTGTLPKNVDYVKGEQKGVWNLLEGMMVISWTCPLNDEGQRARITADSKAITAKLVPLARKYTKNTDCSVSYVVHEGVLERCETDENRAAWKLLLAEGMERLYREKSV